MRKLLLLLALFGGSSISMLATPANDTIAIHQFLKQADALIEAAEYQKALEVQEQALKLCGDGMEKWRVEVLDGMGRSCANLNKGKKAILCFSESLDIRRKLFGELHIQTAIAYNNLGYGYYMNDSFEKALSNYKNASDIYEKKIAPNDGKLSGCYWNIGICYDIMEDSDNAILYFKKGFAIDLSNKDKNILKVGYGYFNLAAYYERQDKVVLAIANYKKALEILTEKLGDKHPQVGWTYGNMGICYKLNEQYDSAFIYYSKEIEIYQASENPNYTDLSTSWNNMGTCLMEVGSYEKSLFFLNKALNINIKNLGLEDSRLALFYENIGHVYKKMNLEEQALINYKTAINCLGCVNIESCVFDSIGLLPDLLDGYNNISTLACIKFKKDRLYENLDTAYIYNNVAIQLIDYITKKFDRVGSEESFIDKYFTIYEQNIEINFLLFEQNKDSTHLYRAFEIAEKSKNLSLLEALRTTEATQFAGIPDSLLEKEESLRLEIADLNEQRFELELYPEEDSESTQLSIDSKTFDLQQEYDHLIDLFEKQYPNYYRLKYKRQFVSIPDIQQQLLGERQALVEYFAGDSSIYLFVIRKDGFVAQRIPSSTSLYTQVEQFRNLIDHTPFSSYQEMGGDNELANISHQLYQKLLEPVVSNLPKELIIVPDGILGYLPFEALLSSLPEQSFRYRSHPYLLHQYQINYISSATLLEELMEPHKGNASKGLLAIAPYFSMEKSEKLASRSDALTHLKYNVPEAKKVKQFIGGELLTGERATVQSFIQKAADFRLLHLATHAKTNDKSGDYSFLAFSKSSDTMMDVRLYASDIYNLELNAEMVVLSACETGVGELVRGEGFISLARAFTYAGAQSLITTLWSVNDNKTSELIPLFYKNIKLGKRKGEALRQAKLTYLKKQKDRAAHPFYWAAFVPYGNMDAINIASPISSYLAWGLLVSNILLLLFFWKKGWFN